MKTFTNSEARQNLAKILVLAQSEDVEIRRRNGAIFSLQAKIATNESPFDLPGIKTQATMNDILNAVCESRSA